MKLTRRDTLAMAMGSAVVAMLPVKTTAAAGEAIAAFTGGAPLETGEIQLIMNEIAENGNTVPVEVNAPGAESFVIVAKGNETPTAATFHFGALATAQSAKIRIRLAETQDVVAIAKMPDGRFIQASQHVKVTIGGCGG